MRNALRFVLILVFGLGSLTWVAYRVLAGTARDWFLADIATRANLVVENVQPNLIRYWSRDDRAAMRDVLEQVTRNERILAAAACTVQGEMVIATSAYPAGLGCRAMDDMQRASRSGAASANAPMAHSFTSTVPIEHGTVHVSAVPVSTYERTLGSILLVHDASVMGRREERARDLLLSAFGVLAFAASIVTVIAAQLARRNWMSELRRVLGQTEPNPEYQPLVKDLRDLVDRLSSERERDAQGARWNPERLKAALSQHLQGERVVIVANREPYIHERTADGRIAVRHPASGLVTALEPVMRACSGVWVAHGSGSADRDVVDAGNRVRVPPGEESYVVRRVWLTDEEERGYYYGFSNEGLWPLCHVAHTRPTFRADDWEHYRVVNQRFADAVCQEVDSDDPIVLVQDYHFALVPKMIRERLPRATILTFWHIPWPNAEHFGICPWRDELLEGMLGSSILGFHTQQHCNNFVDSVDTFIESRIDRERQSVVQGARETLVRPYPISIEWPVRWLDALPSAAECRRSVCDELGLAENALIGVGIDRLDYTKGIEERLLAVERLLERYPKLIGRFTFVQLAAPSRTGIDRYQSLNIAVEDLVQRVNAKYGTGTYRPIVLLRAHHEPPTVFRYYRAAHVCYVSSLHDGMNLVAKEFVAARDDELGVLVLSHFTGAARELTEALIVNPYDLEQASDALATAVFMRNEEQRERMRAMRRMIADFNVYRWAGRMLTDAAQLRGRERLSGRLFRIARKARPATLPLPSRP